MGLGFDYVLRTVLYLYTYLVVQCNTCIFIGRQHVLLALINKSMVDFKIAFFYPQGAFDQIMEKGHHKNTVVIATNIYCMLSALHVFLTVYKHIINYYLIFHKGRN